MGLFGLFNREKREDLDKGLEKSKESIIKRISRAVAGKAKVDDEVLDNLEEALISSDVGVNTTLKIIEKLETRVRQDKYMSTEELGNILSEVTISLLEENTTDTGNASEESTTKPYVIMVVGVNGVGKTTTIGKLAWRYKNQGKSVLLGAADTFRAAAVDQLTIWSERAGVPLVKQQMGSDPASVAFDAVSSGKSSGADIIIIDTAGRLPNKVNMMNEV